LPIDLGPITHLHLDEPAIIGPLTKVDLTTLTGTARHSLVLISIDSTAHGRSPWSPAPSASRIHRPRSKSCSPLHGLRRLVLPASRPLTPPPHWPGRKSRWKSTWAPQAEGKSDTTFKASTLRNCV